MGVAFVKLQLGFGAAVVHELRVASKPEMDNR